MSKKATMGELAKQFVKEAATGAFSRARAESGGAASKASQVVRERSKSAEGVNFDSNTYHRRQHSDDSNSR
jgi:hypothetical protein